MACPQTSDNIFGYIMLGIISIIGITSTGIIVKKNYLTNKF